MPMNDIGDLWAAARRHHVLKVNDVVRRPGMYGRDETAERLLLEALAAVDGILDRWQDQCQALRDRGAFTATGVMGAYRHIVPEDAVRDAAASIYAEIAHRFGWLSLDRALPEAEFQQLNADVGGWVARDRTLSEVIAMFGAPSLWIGPTSCHRAKTLAYASADPKQTLICFHLAKTPTEVIEPEPAGVSAEPVVLAVRHRPGEFTGSFTFTPEGRRRRPTTDQLLATQPGNETDTPAPSGADRGCTCE